MRAISGGDEEPARRRSRLSPREVTVAWDAPRAIAQAQAVRRARDQRDAADAHSRD